MELQHLPRGLSFNRSSSALRSYDKLQQPHHSISPRAPEHDSGAGGRRARSRCILAAVCCVLALVATAALGTVIAVGRARSSSRHSQQQQEEDEELSSGMQAIQAACNTTMYPALCVASLSADPDAKQAHPVALARIGVKLALDRVHSSLEQLAAANLTHAPLLQRGAIRDCIELMDDAKDHLNDSLSSLRSIKLTSFRTSLTDAKLQLSGTMSYHLACSDGLSSLKQPDAMTSSMLAKQEDVSQSVIVALDLVDTLSNLGSDLSSWKSSVASHIPHFKRRRRLLADDLHADDSGFPHWVSAADRKLLQTPASSASADAVVAQDGSGNFKTIQAAINSVPSSKTRTTRYTIRIKAGTYSEYVSIPKAIKDLTLIGDGIGVTVITGSKSNAQQLTTYDTGTVAADGDNFIARYITFRNTAGPDGHQAVAMRVKSKQAVFDTCSFEGYQDTLYALANRQFYTGCTISGTVDFIFGNAIAVFQNCKLVGRKPNSNQQNTLTAHGRKTDSDLSGYSFQKCTLSPAADLPASVRSYLGRPWKAYSRTVFLQCSIGAFIDPAGWLAWDPSNPSLFTDTLYYGEYQNAGAGAATANRVLWKGVHASMSLQEASRYTVEQFIAGSSWLPAAQVSYLDNLS